jgi:branched-chain amino acid transport system substrate-binding protein
MHRALAVLIGGLAAFAAPALAQPREEIVVGYVVSATGSNASLGVHYRNAEQLFPTEIAGTKVRYIVRDDASDSTQALNIVRQLISEDHVDAIIGPSLTTSALAVIQLMNDDHVPEIATSPFPLDPKTYPWTFSLVQTGALMMQGVAAHMQAHGIHHVGFIGFSDSFGDQILQGIQAQAATSGLSITSEQRYARSDTSVPAPRPLCPASPCASAASPARSIPPTELSTRISSVSAAPAWKARSRPPARSACMTSCPTATPRRPSARHS